MSDKKINSASVVQGATPPKQDGWVLCGYGCGTYVHLNPSNPTARLAVWNHLCLNKLADINKQMQAGVQGATPDCSVCGKPTPDGAVLCGECKSKPVQCQYTTHGRHVFNYQGVCSCGAQKLGVQGATPATEPKKWANPAAICCLCKNALSDHICPSAAVQRESPPEYPKPCGICSVVIQSKDDLDWHGYGNCRDIPEIVMADLNIAELLRDLQGHIAGELGERLDAAVNALRESPPTLIDLIVNHVAEEDEEGRRVIRFTFEEWMKIVESPPTRPEPQTYDPVWIAAINAELANLRDWANRAEREKQLAWESGRDAAADHIEAVQHSAEKLKQLLASFVRDIRALVYPGASSHAPTRPETK